MGCAQSRKKNEECSMISCEIKYLLPELVQAIKLGQQCIYSEESPIKLTPVKEIGGIFCKLESLLPTGSVKMRAIYHMLYRLHQKKRHKGMDQMNLVICSSGNAAMACIECLKLLKKEKKQEISEDQTISEFPQDDTPTDPGLSAIINNQQLSSKIKPYQLLGQLIIFCKHLNEIHTFNDLPNVQVINSQLNKPDIEIEAFKYAQDHGYDYIDLLNDVDVFGGYATIGFEIDQWQILTNTKIDYVFVTLKSGALIAAIAFYLKYIALTQIQVIGVMLYGSTRSESTMCSQIIEGFIDEIIFVTTQDVEKAQCELAKAEFNSAIAYAGCKKTQYKNSLVVLSGSNIAVSNLSKLITKYQ
ncbi:unnamed protein product (macronuclear) [Paramecium tetraurelia]|uniref:Tryptophan synthase beta chain-like PALP domain-containing protein n=1 Tax=Paramecium tetraurelia TaxID=5888 RepID=A0DMZ2_PARTE|nr:uncharacterized protein GSPATT00018614001 [Paramecium tetraurelia]CAK84409.1 unnamed protein product [Paramecium tetraurelia]|eukprot:XP_001451806.1 hypothetical protein (macronuclear) [Paramecium tetraurelia strain d4-2]